MTKKTTLSWQQFAVAASLMVLVGCSEEKQAAAPEARPVKVVTVAEPDEGRLLQYSGAVKARREIALGFRVDGKITERLIDVGQRVKSGDVLARLDPVDYELSVRQAEAELASAEKQVDITRLALRRAEILQEKSVTSQSALEQSQLSHDQAVAARDAAVSALEQARNKVSYASLKAGVDGIVTAVSAEAGQVVAAGSSVVTVAADGAKEVEIAVPEVDISEFKPGKAVKASFWSNSGLSLTGTVREIAGSASSTSRTFAVRVSLPDDPQLRLGMTATVTATTEGATPAYVLPLSALAKQDGKPVVWVFDQASGAVHVREVTVGGFSDDGVRVTGGIAKGDVVVAAGTQFMREDMKIRLYGQAPETAGEADAAPPIRS
ncbi:efflux RND transporter periplasmic adaptor subunit [Rhizobium sp. SGZ-381]|uniref:efflux RND transporter periplasmic adaptor subunit n=1 Tax=Rhizobium sp. SGZ-381 TaxID=3342800 RepID=UPI0036709B75